ncbi:MAG TPA: hypothetical protein PLL10_10235 [Elusimicrobiales bacterium]|nr:hypothetical protein [Elusimicrobiales bacterium]
MFRMRATALNFARRLVLSQRGQMFSEYLLMLGVIAAFILISVPLFYKQILGAFFLMVGKVLGG